MKIFIHCGTHKTGTTAIQNQLALKRDILLSNGVYYCDCGEIHHNFVLNLRRPDWHPGLITEQLKIAHNLNVESVIFSAEVVSIFNESEIRRLRECFQDNEVVFVLSFRHWCGYWPSRWAQYCKVRDSQSFREYLDQLQNTYSKHIDVRYDLTLSRFLKIPSSQIKIVPYTNFQRSNESILLNILKSFEISDSLIEMLAVEERYINIRPDWVEVEKIRLLNGIISDHLNLKQNSLFHALANFGITDINYNLKLHFHLFDANFMESVKRKIKDSETIITLSGNDIWIQKLYGLLKRQLGSAIDVSFDNQMFCGENQSVVRCTDLKWNDVDSVQLREAIKKMKFKFASSGNRGLHISHAI